MQMVELKKKNDVYTNLIEEIYEKPDLSLGYPELKEIKLKLAQKRMCQEMLRKDFELLKIQNTFCQIFNDAEFFSRPNDDLVSIEHTIQIAHQMAKEDFLGNYFNHLYECGCQLAFCQDAGSPEDKAKSLTTLFFQASTFIEEYDGLRFFLKEFMKAYPQINMPWARAFLRQATAESWESL